MCRPAAARSSSGAQREFTLPFRTVLTSAEDFRAFPRSSRDAVDIAASKNRHAIIRWQVFAKARIDAFGSAVDLQTAVQGLSTKRAGQPFTFALPSKVTRPISPAEASWTSRVTADELRSGKVPSPRVALGASVRRLGSRWAASVAWPRRVASGRVGSASPHSPRVARLESLRERASTASAQVLLLRASCPSPRGPAWLLFRERDAFGGRWSRISASAPLPGRPAYQSKRVCQAAHEREPWAVYKRRSDWVHQPGSVSGMTPLARSRRKWASSDSRGVPPRTSNTPGS